VQAAIQSQFALGGGTVQIAAQLPEMVFSGRLAEGEIALPDLIKFFTLGIVVTPDTDAGDRQPRLRLRRAGRHRFALGRPQCNWSIKPGGIPALTIESLGLAVQIDKSQPAGSQYAGQLTGNFMLLEGTPTAGGHAGDGRLGPGGRLAVQREADLRHADAAGLHQHLHGRRLQLQPRPGPVGHRAHAGAGIKDKLRPRTASSCRPRRP
jgi:hypothetical protein